MRRRIPVRQQIPATTGPYSHPASIAKELNWSSAFVKLFLQPAVNFTAHVEIANRNATMSEHFRLKFIACAIRKCDSREKRKNTNALFRPYLSRGGKLHRVPG